jgi:iron complex outermembrane receptor protein
VIKNVSGVTSIFPYVNIYTDLNIRGTRAGSNALRNGVQLSSGLQEDMSYVEKVEFIKGPAGFMLAQGEPGGMYNVVTKKPLDRSHASATLTTGSYGLFRTSFDAGNRIGNKLSYRVNLMGQKSGTHLDYGQNNRLSIAPVLRYKFSEKTSVTAEYNLDFARVNGTFAQVPTVNKKPVTPLSFMVDDPGIDPASIRSDYGVINLQHEINKDWSLTGQIGVAKFTEENRLLYTNSTINAENKLLRNYRYIYRDYRNGNAQLYLNGNVETGSIGHKLLIGFDGGVREAKSKFAQVDNILPLDTKNPVYGVAAIADTLINESSVSFGPTTKTEWQALSVLDNISITSWLELTVGGRYTYFKSGTELREDNVFTPRAGILVGPFKNTSLYLLYDESFLPQTALSFSGDRFEPLTGNNLEVGLKREFFNKRLLAQFAAYTITKNNVLTTDPDHPGFSIQQGQIKSKGIELDVMGAITNSLTVVANYAYTDATVTKDTDPNTVGTRQQAPVHTVNGWAKYSVRDGLFKGVGVGLGSSYYKDRYIFTRKRNPTDPQQKLEDFKSFNAALYYQLDNVNFSFNVDNVTDEFNFIGTFAGAFGESGEFQYISMPGRNFKLSVSVNF